MEPRLIKEYVESTKEVLTELQGRNQALQQKVASLQETNEELNGLRGKQASAPAVDTDAVAPTVDLLIQAGMLKKASRETAIDSIVGDPVPSLLNFLTKLASNKIAAAGIRPMGNTVSDSTPASARDGKSEADKYYEQAFS